MSHSACLCTLVLAFEARMQAGLNILSISVSFSWEEKMKCCWTQTSTLNYKIFSEPTKQSHSWESRSFIILFWFMGNSVSNEDEMLKVRCNEHGGLIATVKFRDYTHILGLLVVIISNCLPFSHGQTHRIQIMWRSTWIVPEDNP